jgi:hypothetical protein
MDISAWSEFAVATAGASAALTGLVFVAVSINLSRILAYPALPRRTGQTLVLFLVPLFIAVFVLARGQGVGALGVELVGLGVVLGTILLWLSGTGRTAEEPAGSFILARLLPSVLTAAFVIAAGLSLLLDRGGGLLWTVPAVLVSFVGGVGNAWVLLIEIQR